LTIAALIAIITLAAVFVSAYAAGDTITTRKSADDPSPGKRVKIIKTFEGGAIGKVVDDKPSKTTTPQEHHGNHGGISKKIHKIDNLFRSNDNVDTGQAALANKPVIQPLNVTAMNATITMPMCNGVVSGPCWDSTNNAVVP
jgi:hypothetical protein